MIRIKKKDGTLEVFNEDKILRGVDKAAERVVSKRGINREKLLKTVKGLIDTRYGDIGDVTINYTAMNDIVIQSLRGLNKDIANTYAEFVNYKDSYSKIFNSILENYDSVTFNGDRENSNMNSQLVPTKRILIYKNLSESIYKYFYLSAEELDAINKGYIYIHDKSDRLDTFNCCLADVGNVMSGGFSMGNLHYNEPKSLSSAIGVMSDIIMNLSGSQYGGLTISEVDKVLEPYYDKSVATYRDLFLGRGIDEETALKLAVDLTDTALNQGIQQLEYKLNSVGCSRGDYAFITLTFGLARGSGAKVSKAILDVRRGGQGKEGYKKPVLFPKLVFLYDDNLHGDGKELEYLFESALDCSSKAMYPDYLSLTGKGYVADMYKKYGSVISPMGCRAFLSPWYEKGGMEPLDVKDRPIFNGRFNIGAISLNLIMIYAKSIRDNRDFYEVLDYYLELIRGLHLKTYDYLGKLKASCNPVAFCEGGLYGGNLGLNDTIEPLLKSATASFGVTALHELQMLYNNKSLSEDSDFAYEVMCHINDRVQQFKKDDNRLYAIYGKGLPY